MCIFCVKNYIDLYIDIRMFHSELSTSALYCLLAGFNFNTYQMFIYNP